MRVDLTPVYLFCLTPGLNSRFAPPIAQRACGAKPEPLAPVRLFRRLGPLI